MSPARTAVVRDSRLVRRSPVFYGWIIFLVGTLGLIMTSPGQTYAVSVFTEYFIHDLDISRSMVSILYTVGTLVGSSVLPLVGRQIDQRGPRLLMTLIALCFGLACVYMGLVQNAATLALGFILIRMLGQGSLGLVSTNVINQWWVRRRGTIIGISGLFVSLLGLGGFPGLINWLIPIFGWRATYMLLGLMLLVGFVPLILILVRNQPEEYGLQPDGLPSFSPDTIPLTSSHADESWSLPEARQTPMFWILSLGLASIAMLATGLFFHMVSIFRDSGFAPSTAAWAYVPIAVTTALVNLGSGILVDRIAVRLLLALALFLQAGALFLAQILVTPWLAFTYGAVLGTALGLMGTINGVAWAKYFGRQYLGSISGMGATILIVGAALGPMPFGIAHDWLGNYNSVLTISALIPLGLGIACFFISQPGKPTGGLDNDRRQYSVQTRGETE